MQPVVLNVDVSPYIQSNGDYRNMIFYIAKVLKFILKTYLSHGGFDLILLTKYSAWPYLYIINGNVTVALSFCIYGLKF